MLAVIFWAVTLAFSVAAFVMARKGINQETQSTTPDFEATTAEEGKTIPVVFGTCWRGHNVVQYGDISTKAVKAKGGKK